MRIFITGGSGFIGTNMIEALAQEHHSILNYSLHPALNPAQSSYWQAGDILEKSRLVPAMHQFQPDWVLHLAARAECDENTTVEEGYCANVEGTRNILDAIKATTSVRRVVITSSQFVCAPGRLPRNDTDYFPETVYGQSKVISEKLTREANLSCCWTIIRPTNVWGPWHMRYRREFWRLAARRLYFHPGKQPVVRCYGYVKNVAEQIQKIFNVPAFMVNGKTIYLGDPLANLYEWVNGFSVALSGRPARVVPRGAMRMLAAVGDGITAITGKPFLINSSRLRSMTTDYNTPMDETFRLLGGNRYSLEEGIRETVQWLRNYRGADESAGGS